MSTNPLSLALRADLKSGERVALTMVKFSLPGYYSTYKLAREAGVAYTTALRWVAGLIEKKEIQVVNGRCYALED